MWGLDSGSITQSLHAYGVSPIPTQFARVSDCFRPKQATIKVIGFGVYLLARIQITIARACALTNARLRYIRDVLRLMPKFNVVQTM